MFLFPELAITGYPPEDLLMKPRFVSDNLAALEGGRGDEPCVAIVGFVEPVAPGTPSRLGDGGGPARPTSPTQPPSAPAAGSSAIVTGVCCPTTGSSTSNGGSSPACTLYVLSPSAGTNVGVTICEDIWSPGPVAALGQGGADVVVNINASPYSQGRRAERLRMLRQRAAEAGSAIAYCNLVGGQDELVFDGGSTVVDAAGEVLAAGRAVR